MSTITHKFDDHVDGITYCSQCGIYEMACGPECDVVLVRRPSTDQLAGLRQIRTGDVTSVRQTDLADNWIDRLFDSCARQAKGPR